MSSTGTATATYTTVDIENVVRRVKADLVMIADSTGGWTAAKAAEYAPVSYTHLTLPTICSV